MPDRITRREALQILAGGAAAAALGAGCTGNRRKSADAASTPVETDPSFYARQLEYMLLNFQGARTKVVTFPGIGTLDQITMYAHMADLAAQQASGRAKKHIELSGDRMVDLAVRSMSWDLVGQFYGGGFSSLSEEDMARLAIGRKLTGCKDDEKLFERVMGAYAQQLGNRDLGAFRAAREQLLRSHHLDDEYKDTQLTWTKLLLWPLKAIHDVAQFVLPFDDFVYCYRHDTSAARKAGNHGSYQEIAARFERDVRDFAGCSPVFQVKEAEDGKYNVAADINGAGQAVAAFLGHVDCADLYETIILNKLLNYAARNKHQPERGHIREMGRRLKEGLAWLERQYALSSDQRYRAEGQPQDLALTAAHYFAGNLISPVRQDSDVFYHLQKYNEKRMKGAQLTDEQRNSGFVYPLVYYLDEVRDMKAATDCRFIAGLVETAILAYGIVALAGCGCCGGDGGTSYGGIQPCPVPIGPHPG